jgi:hypothetical protein
MTSTHSSLLHRPDQTCFVVPFSSILLSGWSRVICVIFVLKVRFYELEEFVW